MKMADIKEYTAILRKNIVFIITAGIILAIVCGGYKLYSLKNSVPSTESDTTDYSAQMEEYQKKKANIDNYLNIVEGNLAYGFDQIENNPILAIDANNCSYEIITINFEDSASKKDDIFANYIASLDSALIFGADAEKYDKYKADIIRVHSPSSIGCMQIYCFPTEEHSSADIAEKIIAILKSPKNTVIRDAGITSIDRMELHGACSVLRSRQEDILNYPIAIESDIRRIKEQGRLIAAPTSSSSGSGMSEGGMMRSAFKYAVLGGLLGLILGIAFVIYKAACGGVVLFERQIDEKFELDCIGKISGKGWSSDADSALRGSISAIASGRDHILILDRAYPETFAELVSYLNKSAAGSTSYAYGKDIIDDTAVLNNVNMTDGIIIGIDKGITTFDDIYKTIVRSNTLNKKVIGYLFAE